MTDENVNQETVNEQVVNQSSSNGQTSEEEKKKKQRETFEMVMEEFRQYLQISSKDDGFRYFIEQYGYNTERINVGIGNWDITIDKNNQKLIKKAEYHTASREARIIRVDADNTYMHHVDTSRLAFKDDPDTCEKLLLKGAREHNLGGWAHQAATYYENILAMPAAVEEMAKHNVPLEELQAGQQKVKAALEAAEVTRQKKAEAEDATQQKNKAYKILKAWMRDFLKIVDIAFKENPQFKEKAGFVVPLEK